MERYKIGYTKSCLFWRVFSQYPQTNEKVFAELMANEMADKWELEPTDKSRKFKIDGRIRVSKKFYVRKNVPDFIEVTDDIELPF